MALPDKENLIGNPTAGMYKMALGAFYDYVKNMIASTITFTPSGNISATDVQSAIQELDLEKIAVSGGTMAGALHQPAPISLATVSGVLTLTEGGNSFTVSGTEDLTQIIGWSAGRVVIKWGGARTIKNNSNIAITINADRSVLAGDISEFEFTTTGVIREINYQASSIITPQTGVPVGAYLESASTITPTGYLPCVGDLVSRTTYADLFAAIGVIYGAGDGSTTFKLPDRRDRFALAKGTTYATLGATGGEATHVLTTVETPNHSHEFNTSGPNTPLRGVVEQRNFNPSGTSTSTAVGGGGAHNNMPPYFVVNYYIKY